MEQTCKTNDKLTNGDCFALAIFTAKVSLFSATIGVALAQTKALKQSELKLTQTKYELTSDTISELTKKEEKYNSLIDFWVRKSI